MNEEQLIATLQACYFGDKGAFNKILKEYKQLQQENHQLKEKLKKIEHILNNQMDYREFVDMINAIEDIIRSDIK